MIDIELPEMPQGRVENKTIQGYFCGESYYHIVYSFDADQIQQYARAAVEAYIAKQSKINKMAPVQGYAAGIPWSIHLQAYDAYCKKWSPQPALIDLDGRNCRGGFHVNELDEFIPGWREQVSEITALKAEIESLKQSLAQPAQEPIATVVSKYGDPESFGERELSFDEDVIKKLPYGTKLYAQQPAQAAVPEDTRTKIRDAIADALGDAMDCTRVWSAWSVGTMTEDDFACIVDDESRLMEIVDAAIGVMSADKNEWRATCEALVDIWEDAEKPEEHRCYVSNAFPSLMQDLKESLNAAPDSEKGGS